MPGVGSKSMVFSRARVAPRIDSQMEEKGRGAAALGTLWAGVLIPRLLWIPGMAHSSLWLTKCLPDLGFSSPTGKGGLYVACWVGMVTH